MSTSSTSLKLPVLPLRDIVVFPHMVVPLFVGRDKSVAALEEVVATKGEILLLAQKTATEEDPNIEDLYRVGTVSRIVQLLKLPDGTIKVLVEGVRRVKVRKFVTNKTFFKAEVEDIQFIKTAPKELNALARTVIAQFEDYVKLDKKIPLEVLDTIAEVEDLPKLADLICSHLSLKISEKQALLELESLNTRFEKMYEVMESEIGTLNIEQKIRSRVKKQMEKTQRDYYLNEQMKAIQKELGESEDGKDEIGQLEAKIKKTKLSKEARKQAEAEIKKLRMMSPMSAESSVVRNYLDWLIGIPWGKRTKIKTDLDRSEDILNQDHYGLEKVKERILEYLAVQKRVGKVKGSIICLVGPPGVGKTSLGKSIAKSTGREFTRIALGGVRDEAEIRGHRRTYIGAMPGKIIQGMKKAGSTNPLFLLDEIDKLGADWRGDPSSSLLEVLDPEQNSKFNDHYLEVDYDLSEVMFVTTANTLNIPAPLLDRMEIIRLSGYTEQEKVEIVKRHLLPRSFSSHGLKKKECTIEDAAILDVIRYYTREAGVRNLEREVSKLVRKVVTQIVRGKGKSVKITPKNLEKYLGVKKFLFGEIEEKDLIGVTNGLAWTEVGGEMLLVESVVLPGKGKVQITGKLGDVMQESVQASFSYVRSKSKELNISKEVFEKNDIHVHVPEGAIPKDGPSAGVVMCTSIVSALTGIPVKKDIAMTGEITLRGRVLPIGGLKEKLLAALRAGIKTVLIPIENKKDLAEIPENILEHLDIKPVETVDEVLKFALIRPVGRKKQDKPPSEIEFPIGTVSESTDTLKH